MLGCSIRELQPMSGSFPTHRRSFVRAALAAAAALATTPLRAQVRPERGRITLAVGGKSNLLYLPLTVAEQLGYFRSEGLSVEFNDAGNAQRSLELLQEGAVEVCAGPFEQVLLLQARGTPQQAFVMQCRAPQLALGVSTRTLPHYRSVADLKGRRLGVAESGPLAGVLARRVLGRAGLRPEDVNWVDIGPSAAITALRGGQLDALVQWEPAISTLEQRAEVRIVADSRTLKGTTEVFGGPMPASCLHASAEFVQRFPGTCQALAHAIVHALKWLQTAGPGDILKTVPEPYLLGDRALYLAAFNKVRETISPDGLLQPEAARNAQRVLAGADNSQRLDRLDIDRAYTNEFARRAKERFRA
jgi:NitT/TauT family transport system substrate-binding protein